MLGALARRVFGTANDRIVKALDRQVAEINALEPEIEKLSDEALRARTDQLREACTTAQIKLKAAHKDLDGTAAAAA